MNTIQTSYSVVDYFNAMERGEIIVNKHYQRSDAVWPEAAQAFFVETILLGYPIPKLLLYQVTDIKSRRTHKEIVDGQQRSQVIRSFIKDEIVLSRSLRSEELRGKRYSQLDVDAQARFLDYAISVDLFVSATPDEIREVFRRINSYTVPLNPEEQRHAEFQGHFKWFIYELSSDYDDSLHSMGVFSEKQLVRMADSKLFSEIVHALLYDITTTNKMKLNALYRNRDKNFPELEDIRERIKHALDILIGLREIHQGALMKPYIVYSFILAVTHVLFSPVPRLSDYYEVRRSRELNRRRAMRNLTLLQEALQNPEDSGEFDEFVAACAEKTNVANQRIIRFQWLARALAESF